jgi:hypothetical protein
VWGIWHLSGEKGNADRLLYKNLKKTDHWEDLSIDRRIPNGLVIKFNSMVSTSP